MNCSTCKYCKSITKTDGLCVHTFVSNGKLVVSKNMNGCIAYEKNKRSKIKENVK